MRATKDPKRWVDDPESPKGVDELLGIDPAPPLTESVRARVRDQIVHATAVPMTPQLAWRAPVLGAAAIVLAGILLWRFQPGPDEPEVELRSDVVAEVDQVVAQAETPQPAASNLARVRVTSEPSGAQIYVDGVLRGTSPLIAELAAGTYGIEARMAGYASARVSHRVVASQATSVALVLAAEPTPVVARAETMRAERRADRPIQPRHPPDPRGHGWFTVNTRPWSRVFIDGREIGLTPIVRHQLASGRHRVRFETASGIVQTISIQIRPGENTRVIRNLEPTMQSTMRIVPDNPF